MTGQAPLRIAFAVHTFPVLTETFILEPIVHLLARGHDVEILALYRGDAAAEHPVVREHGLLARARFLIDDRPGRGRLRKLRQGAAHVLRRTRTRVPWARVVRDATRPSVRRVAPELILAAAGAAAADGSAPLAYDVIHAHIGRAALVMQHLRDWGLLRGPLLATFHGSDVTVEPGRQAPGYYGRLFAGADGMTTNSEFLRRELIALGAPADRCWRLPVGVDPGDLPFRPRTPEPDAPVRVLTVARLSEAKGLEHGIRAVHALEERGIEVRYTIVGEGPQRGELEALIETLGVGDLVTLAGGLSWDRVREAYASHHLFLFPVVPGRDGCREAQGKVLAEAQAAGLPFVATRVGGVPETAAPGAGLLVEPGDPGALADALASLLADPDAWPDMGRRGRAHVESHLDNGRLVDALLDRYRAVAAQ